MTDEHDVDDEVHQRATASSARPPGGPRWAGSSPAVAAVLTPVPPVARTGFGGGPGPLTPALPGVVVGAPSLLGSTAILRPRTVDHASRYSRSARSAVPHAAAALVAIALAAVLVVRAVHRMGPSAGGSELWINVTGFFVGMERTGPGHESLTGAEWLAMGGLVLALGAIAAWVSRLGWNLPLRDRPFGVLLTLAIIPSWWVFPITFGITDFGHTWFGTAVRAVLAVVLILGLAGVRALGVARIWRAGDLPGEPASLVISVVALVPTFLFFAATANTIIARGEFGRGTSAWEPTQGLLDLAQAGSRGAASTFLLLLLAVTVGQHRNLAAERAAAVARADAAQAEG